jgi:hypothetical protein
MAEHAQVVKGGPQGRSAGTAAKRRPLTTGDRTAATMNNAPPAGGAYKPTVPHQVRLIRTYSVPAFGASSVRALTDS